MKALSTVEYDRYYKKCEIMAYFEIRKEIADLTDYAERKGDDFPETFREKLDFLKKCLESDRCMRHYINVNYMKGYRGSRPSKDNPNLYGSDCFPTDKIVGTCDIQNSRLRVPKLKRKSAWKRFYKLFPNLKGQEVYHGSSSANFRPLNRSTIKLKK